ncbi:hypothetical protein EJ08DRAFT_671105 [Tothia fuscella]|uniref:Altered inheritance of mitochondria protein 9, mitochondrial n=1 Tax=Tothia fuscella TaxID=1048955 RepID=A0A9P4NPZ7_9PEZI|nr:hypothetical protein EJ08DRAFT_671105 [Tothia fuscella]
MRNLRIISTILGRNAWQKPRVTLQILLRVRSSQVSKDSSTLSIPPGLENDPYDYTDGRWLHQDRIQRQARHVKFDFHALCKRVIELSPQARRVTHCEKKEGGSNRVFVFTLDNGERLVARIPFGIAGPRRYTMGSEVATMEYLRAKTTIPIPKFRDWSDETSRIGCEYMIMEHAPGVQLHGVWPKMNTHQRMLCIKALAKIIQQMTQLKFPALGDDFCIGAHTGTHFWDCDPTSPSSYTRTPPNRGPWSTIEEYNLALIDAGIAQIPDNPYVSDNNLSYRGSADEHLRLLEIARVIVTKQLPNTPQVRATSTRTLLHPDLHARNIFVSEEDPAQITAIIDWQSTSIEPAFRYVNYEPDMIDFLSRDSQYAGAIPIMSEETESLETKAKREKDIEICRKTYAVGLQAWSPALFLTKVLEEDYFRLLRFVPNSWAIGAAAIRQELIDLKHDWKKLDIPGECAYQPSSGELLNHKKDYEDLEVRHKLKLWLQDSLDSNGDGWVPTEEFEAAGEVHKSAFEIWLESSREEFENGEKEATEEWARELWPWDGNGKL